MSLVFENVIQSKVGAYERWNSICGRYSIQRFEYRTTRWKTVHCEPYYCAYAVWDRSQGIGEAIEFNEIIDICNDYEAARGD
jgi:hypothetical protein